MASLPTGLYIHFPWCVRKCPYCDFNSHPVSGAIPESAYLDRLLADLDEELQRTGRDEIQTVFIGGGTPSLCSGAGVARLLDGIRRRCTLPAGAEITLEANPGTADAANFAQYRDAGVTRLSIGAQSFDPGQLTQLGRIHDPTDIARAVQAARAAGFEHLNLDLMYGLPGQRPEQAVADLEAALALMPEHLSWYQLTIEPRTVFAERPPLLPIDSILAETEARGLAVLDAAGYERYEVSAFAQPGQRCRHNLNYWKFGDYLGIGAGAHGKLSDLPSDRIERTEKPRQPRLYLRGDPGALLRRAPVSHADRPAEFMMNVLRLTDGVEESLFPLRTGLPVSAIRAPLGELRDAGLMAPDRLCLTGRGRRLLDSVVAQFL